MADWLPLHLPRLARSDVQVFAQTRLTLHREAAITSGTAHLST